MTLSSLTDELCGLSRRVIGKHQRSLKLNCARKRHLTTMSDDQVTDDLGTLNVFTASSSLIIWVKFLGSVKILKYPGSRTRIDTTTLGRHLKHRGKVSKDNLIKYRLSARRCHTVQAVCSTNAERNSHTNASARSCRILVIHPGKESTNAASYHAIFIDDTGRVANDIFKSRFMRPTKPGCIRSQFSHLSLCSSIACGCTLRELNCPVLHIHSRPDED